MTPLVSVLMPIFRPGPWLKRAVTSILEQSLAEFELIMVDDGSEDPQPIRRAAALDRRIRVVTHASNRGVGAALNTAIAAARAPFLARMDADDVAMPDRLRRQVALLKTSPELLAVGSSYLRIDSDGKPLRVCRRGRCAVSTRWALLTRSAVLHPTVMLRRAVFDEHSLHFDPALSLAQDLDLFQRISEIGDVVVMPEILLHYRVHPESATQSARPAQIGQHLSLVRRALERGRWADASDTEVLLELVRDYLNAPSTSSLPSRARVGALVRFVETFLERQRCDARTARRIRADAAVFLLTATLRARRLPDLPGMLLALLGRHGWRVLAHAAGEFLGELAGLLEGWSGRPLHGIARGLS